MARNQLRKNFIIGVSVQVKLETLVIIVSRMLSY